MTSGSNGWPGAYGAIFSLALLLPAAGAATDDITNPLTLRVGDARGVPGGEVTIQLRTYQSRPVKQGRITVGGKTTGGVGGARIGLPGILGGVATLPFASCGGPIVFSAAADAVVSPGVFDSAGQTFEFDFSSLSATINASDGPLAWFVCTLAAGVAAGETYDLELSIAVGDSALDDPGLDPVLLVPRPGRLRIRDTLDPGLGIEDTEVKPGAVAVVEIGTEWAFPIDSGQVEIEINPEVVRETPSARIVPRHGTVAIGTQSWTPDTGRFTFDFSSSDDTLNAVIPGTLFEINIPTVPDLLLVGLSEPLSLIAGSTFLVGPGATTLTLDPEDGTLLFSLDPKVEDVFRDGFGGGTPYPWSSQSGWSGE